MFAKSAAGKYYPKCRTRKDKMGSRRKKSIGRVQKHENPEGG